MRTTKTEAVEVFRQFAWNLAGSLALPTPRRRPPARPRPRPASKP
jgi:hypothetical protein